ncbi:MAG TPA: 3-dehydroquinate synthase [Acidobacteriota bacterium]|nr:3-dehydroquinate synthase [Acidobacteriota bacterium]
MEFTCRAIQERTYQILLEWNAIDRISEILAIRKITGPFFVISDRNVFRRHGKRLLKALGSSEVHTHLVSPGEPSKSLQNWNRIQNFFLQNGADRRSVVLAFGGGVVGDLAGFSASTYMRGLDLIQIPTTVLSQSDSSIGAKVAVNHPQAKNLIGSFYQPRLVITDPSLLSTLPPREFSAGLGEAIKYGVIADPRMFDLLYEEIEKVLAFHRELLSDLITRCVRIKIQVVEEDERELGLRKILNFGHTIGHALEQATRYKRLRHGEAVGWGMLAAGRIAVQRGMWAATEFEQLHSILFRSRCLYPLGKLTAGLVLEALKHDKKKTGKSLNFILPERTGKVSVVRDVTREQILDSLRFIFDINKRKGRAAAR